MRGPHGGGGIHRIDGIDSAPGTTVKPHTRKETAGGGLISVALLLLALGLAGDLGGLGFSWSKVSFSGRARREVALCGPSPATCPLSQLPYGTGFVEASCREFARVRRERRDGGPSLAPFASRPSDGGEVRDLRDVLPRNHACAQVAADRESSALTCHAEPVSPYGEGREPHHSETGRDPREARAGLRCVGNSTDARDNSETAVRKTGRDRWRQFHDAPRLCWCLPMAAYWDFSLGD